MKLKHIVLTSALAVGVIALASCSTSSATSKTTVPAATTTAATSTDAATTTAATTTVATTTESTGPIVSTTVATTTAATTTINPVSTTTQATTTQATTTAATTTQAATTTVAPQTSTSTNGETTGQQGEGDGIVDKDGQITVIDCMGEQESAYIEYTPISGATSYNVYVEGGKYSTSTLVNSDVAYTRATSSAVMRTDLLGLTAGNYKVKVIPVFGDEESNAEQTEVSLKVTAYDRSGYAHFKYTDGVGAYNDDGTLKDDAIVIYVTDDNKDTVMKDICEKYDSLSMFQIPSTYTNDYMGQDANSIGWWLNNTQFSKAEKNSKGEVITPASGQKTSDTYSPNGASLGFAQLGTTHPIVVRFVGEVTSPIGLTVYDSYKQGGSEGDNGQMARMKNLLNVTLEGVGDDAAIEGWGFHFINADRTGTYGKSFEVRNLLFDKYAEDGIGMEGVVEDDTLTCPVQRCWIHHNTFLPGYCANPAESDKDEGDGSCDFKRGLNYTLSYNYFEYCHKTNLIGSGSDDLQYDVSLHHNVWYNCGSRIPLLRKANCHFYNNYVFGDSSDNKAELSYVHSARLGSYIYSENNYYEGCKKIAETSESSAVKAFDNEYVGCFEADQSVIVSDRETQVASPCAYGSISYENFDTNSSLFYYDSTNKKSDCYLTTAVVARQENIKYSGSRYRTKLGNTTLKPTNINYSGITPANAVEVPSTGVNTVALPSTKGSSTVDNIEWTNITGSTSTSCKFKANGGTFKVSTYATITVEGSGSASNAKYGMSLVREDGTVVLNGFGSAVLAPGTYTFVACIVDKETTITSITFEKFDSDAIKQQLIDEYNEAYSQILSEITFTDACYTAIKNAITAYEALGDYKSEVTTEPYTAFDSYIALNISYVEDLISAIGTVSSESSTAITAARTAYNALIAKDSDAVVSNYSVLVAAEEEYQSYAVDGCIDLINAIGTVTLDSGNAINLARTAYDSLSSTQKASVTNYSVLTAAEETYNNLVVVDEVNTLISNTSITATIDDIKSVLDAYNALTETQQAMISDTAKLTSLKVAYVEALIDKIPATVSYSDVVTVTTARAAYNALTEDEQALVSNYDKLTEGEAQVADLGIETLTSYSSSDFTSKWDVSGGTATTSGVSASVHSENSVTMVSSFAMSSISSLVVNATFEDKKYTTLTAYYSLDGGENWITIASGTVSGNKSAKDVTLSPSATITGPAMVKLVVTCTKDSSNAKSASINKVTIA